MAEPSPDADPMLYYAIVLIITLVVIKLLHSSECSFDHGVF